MATTCAATTASKQQEASRDSTTYWKAANIPSSSSSSHGSILSAGPADEGVSGRREWDGRPGPTTTKRLRASEIESCSLIKLLHSKNPLPLNLFKKKNPQTQFSVCACAYVYVWVCSCFFFVFSFLAWCQMFQLSTAVQHRRWWI